MQGGDAKGGADKSNQLPIKDSRESRVKMLLFAMVASICDPARELAPRLPRESDQRALRKTVTGGRFHHLHDPAHRKIALDNTGPCSLTSHDYSSSTTIILFLLESAMRRRAQGVASVSFNVSAAVSVPLLSSRHSI
jgi:hypothetical protein